MPQPMDDLLGKLPGGADELVQRSRFGFPRLRPLRPRRRRDYAHLPGPYLELACKLASPLRGGPPLCDQLVALVQHVFTEEEAAVACHLGTFLGRTASQVARLAERRVDEIEPVLEKLALGKRAIGALGPAEKRRYHLLPVMPGMFELILVGQSPQELSPWPRRPMRNWLSLALRIAPGALQGVWRVWNQRRTP